MKSKKAILIFLIVIISSLQLFGTQIDEILPKLTQEEKAALIEGETLERFLDKKEDLTQIVPVGSFLEKKITDSMTNGVIAVCKLRFIPVSEDSGVSEDSDIVDVLNILCSFSTLKGMKYISSGKEKTLILDAYAIEDPEDTGSIIEDKVFTTLPEPYTGYYYQKDNKFGSMVYSAVYSISETEICVELSNNSKMKPSVPFTIPTGDYSNNIDVIKVEGGYLVLAMSRVINLSEFAKNLLIVCILPDSFSRRLDSFVNWFETSLKNIPSETEN